FQAWEQLNKMNQKDSGYSLEEIEAQAEKINELRVEKKQLETVLEDIRAGKEIDVAQLPQTLQKAIADKQFVDDLLFAEQIDFDTIPADKMDLAAEAILQGGDKE